MFNTQKNSISLLGLSIWLIASLFFLYEFSLRTMVGTMASQLIKDLGLTPSMYALLGSAYYFTYGCMQIPAGVILDKFGLRNTLIFAISICITSTFCLSSANGYFSAFFYRILMGFGSSFGFVCLLMIVAQWFPKYRFGFFAGLGQFIGTLGPLLAAGPLAYILKISNGNWRIVLQYIGIIGVLLLTATALIVKNKPKALKSVNTSNTSIKEKLRQIFKNKQIIAISTYSALVYAPMALLGAVWGTLLLQSNHLPQHEAANVISVAWFGYASGCLLFGLVSDSIKRRKVMLMFCATLGLSASTGITYLHYLSATTYSLLFFIIGLAASGLSVACAATSENADGTIKATAFGLNNGTVMILNVMLPPIIGLIIGWSASSHVNTFTPKDFSLGLTIIPILYLSALICASKFIKETYCKQQKPLEHETMQEAA